MRATNHHGRGTAKHAGRDFDLKKAPHIDPARAAQNRYWTWNGDPKLEAAERAYYRETFQDALDTQNQLHRQRRQYKRVRDIDQVYENRNTQPEGSLLYIGCKKDGPIDPDVLWACAAEYRAWEQEQLGGRYVPLSMAMHVDEKGQIHVEERGVYRYQTEAGQWTVGQAAALEAAGVPLPDPDKPRDTDNNRKMTWDAARREKWLDIVEAHGFTLERTPEQQRPHLGLEAWQAWQDEKAALDAQRAELAQNMAQKQAEDQAGLYADQDAQTIEQAAIDAQKRALSLRDARQAQQQASVQEWAANLATWAEEQKRRLDGEAAQIAASESDAAVLAELSRLRAPDGRTLREVLEADMKARPQKPTEQPVTVAPPPEPNEDAQEAIDAQKAIEAEREAEKARKQQELENALKLGQEQQERDQARKQRQQGSGFSL